MQLTDEDIKRDVMEQLRWDSRIITTKIDITVEEGAVTLSGSVPTQRARTAAEQGAQGVKGVHTVHNALDVDFTPADGADLPDDETIRQNAVNAILRDADLSPQDISIEVENGWLTLTGAVKAYWQSVVAEEQVRTVNGVRGVYNKLAVTPEGDIADEVIAQDVLDALSRSNAVNADDVYVLAEDGAIELTGIVGSWEEKRAAFDAARYTEGVTDVDDQIKIDPIKPAPTAE